MNYLSPVPLSRIIRLPLQISVWPFCEKPKKTPAWLTKKMAEALKLISFTLRFHYLLIGISAGISLSEFSLHWQNEAGVWSGWQLWAVWSASPGGLNPTKTSEDPAPPCASRQASERTVFNHTGTWCPPLFSHSKKKKLSRIQKSMQVRRPSRVKIENIYMALCIYQILV